MSCSPLIFPADWPWRAWFVFEGALLASVYERSADLWPLLRDDARDVTSWLEHLDYEGEIPVDGTMDAASQSIPNWPAVEGRLAQARNLLGKDRWNALTSAAATAHEQVGRHRTDDPL